LPSRRHNDGPNDVAGNENLETEQDGAPEILSIKRIIIARVVRATKRTAAAQLHMLALR
jgi:hypothetical protein